MTQDRDLCECLEARERALMCKLAVLPLGDDRRLQIERELECVRNHLAFERDGTIVSQGPLS